MLNQKSSYQSCYPIHPKRKNIMRLVHKLAFTLLSLVTFGTAWAEPISMTDKRAEAPHVRLGGDDLASYAFTHSFLDEMNPYVAGVDTITSAILTIRMEDNGRDEGGPETFRFVFGGQTFGGFNQTNQPFDYEIDLISALAGLSATGVLDVEIFADSGSFRFTSSSLAIVGTRGEIVVPPAEVPEPISIALIALGMAGISTARRRK